MFEKIKARIAFDKLLSRPDINKAYALTDPSDSWYPTLKKVHDSLVEVRQRQHDVCEVESADGLKLRGIVYPALQSEAAGTVIFIHGYTSHAEREWAFPALFYLSLGFNVVIPYQRAHGLSEGKYITFGAKEKDDMFNWIDFAAKRFENCPIAIHGLSMGGGIALQLCDVKCDNVRCIVSDAPGFGIRYIFDYVAGRFGKSKSKVYDEICKLFLKRIGVDVHATDIEQYVAQSLYPLFLTAGSNEDCKDKLDALKQICPRDVTITILPDCDHGNGMYKQTELFQTELKAFLERYFDCQS